MLSGNKYTSRSSLGYRLRNLMLMFYVKVSNSSCISDYLIDLVHIWYVHTCHQLLTDICEILQIFREDLMKFCEIFMKVTFKLI